jgi:hypothetical protein
MSIHTFFIYVIFFDADRIVVLFFGFFFLVDVTI